MAIKNTNLSHFSKEEVPSAKGLRFGIVVSEWNRKITNNLYNSAYNTLVECGANTDDIILASLALGCIGDAYMELLDTDNALSYYEDAASYSDNEFTTPRYMLKQAMIHESNGDYADALDLYKEIEADYKTSREGNSIEKYIARAENR